MLGENGIIRQAEKTREHQANAEASEQDLIESIDDEIANILVENSDDELEPELKPMVLKFGPINEGDDITICVYESELEFEYEESVELPDNTDVTIDWGDGSIEHYTSDSLDKGNATHDYEEAKEEVTVTISGTCNVIETNCVKEIVAWGNTESYYYSLYGYAFVSVPSPEKNTFKNVISFEDTFMYCDNLTSIPDDIFANCSSVKSFANTFYCCSSLTSIPDDIFANCSSVKSFGNTFYGCSSLTSIPDNLFKYCTSVEYFIGTFGGCENLLNIPEHLFDNCQNVIDFQATFAGCTALTGEAIPLWERIQNPNEFWNGIPNGYCCYLGCEGLANYESIPNYWKYSEK